MPKIKGKIGENKVTFILKGLPSDEYTVINDLMLKTTYGTSQIDHIVVSQYGIFVIETKNYSGWIYGGEHSEEWIKNVYGKKYKFRNPIKQNYAHIKALMEVLGVTNIDIFIPIITFPRKASIKVKTDYNIVYYRQLIKCIKSYSESCLCNEQISEYVNKLNNFVGYSKEIRKEHIEEIMFSVTEREYKENEGICPRCNGMLVKRHGKYGTFYGCSNYPRCRYIKR